MDFAQRGYCCLFCLSPWRFCRRKPCTGTVHLARSWHCALWPCEPWTLCFLPSCKNSTKKRNVNFSTLLILANLIFIKMRCVTRNETSASFKYKSHLILFTKRGVDSVLGLRGLSAVTLTVFPLTKRGCCISLTRTSNDSHAGDPESHCFVSRGGCDEVTGRREAHRHYGVL